MRKAAPCPDTVAFDAAQNVLAFNNTVLPLVSNRSADEVPASIAMSGSVSRDLP